MNCSILGFPVLHYLPEFAPTHVHQVSDAIQPFHLLLPSSSLAFHLSQRRGLFQWVNSLHQVMKLLELQLQHQPFQWIFRANLLKDWLVWSPCCLRESQESSPAPQFKSINCLVLSLLYGPTRLWSIQDYWSKHQLFGSQPSLWSNKTMVYTRLLVKAMVLSADGPLSAKWCLCYIMGEPQNNYAVWKKSEKWNILCMFPCICFLEMQINIEWQKKINPWLCDNGDNDGNYMEGSTGRLANKQEESLGFYEAVNMENIKCSEILEATFFHFFWNSINSE